MSALLLLHLLVLSFSSYSCNARDLGVLRNDPTKHVENYKNDRALQQHQPINVNERVVSATSAYTSDSESLGSLRGTRGVVISGLKNFKSSSSLSLRQTAKFVGTGSRSRSVLASGSNVGHVAAAREETKESNERNAVDEEVAAMDYAQPHRNPPIHNK